jgi:hypothetical protein
MWMLRDLEQAIGGNDERGEVTSGLGVVSFNVPYCTRQQQQQQQQLYPYSYEAVLYEDVPVPVHVRLEATYV